MKIAGFKNQSLIDYSGNISSVVFTQGCNFRCGFCHNPDLVLPENFEKTYLSSQLKKFKGNIAKTANFIGMERSALHRKLKSLGIKGIN